MKKHPIKFPALESPDSLHVEAAEAWCELNALDEAQAELDKVKPEQRNHPGVLDVRWIICSKLNRWPEALQIANTMMDLIDNLAGSSNCCEMACLMEVAWTNRQLAAKLYCDQPRVYELACMCCVLGKLDKAKMLLDNAIGVRGDSVRHRARQDRHLEPLWRGLRKQ